MIAIEGALLIDPASGTEQHSDLLVDGGVVKEIDKPGAFAKSEVSQRILAKGLWLLPGLVDIHVHLREPGYEWKETVRTGTRAAVLGGFASVVCLANTNPVHDNAEVTRFILEKAQLSNLAKVYPIGAVSIGLEGKQLAPLSELRKAGCIGFSDDGEPVWDALLMRRALEWSSMLNAPVLCHQEDKCLVKGGCMNESALSLRMGLQGRPRAAEDIMVARDIELVRSFGGHAHFCHISTARSTELIRRAKNDGIRVTAEVTPHHLVLTEDAIAQYDTNAKMNPPLRLEEDLAGLLDGLKDGTLDAIASDHAPHHADSKNVEFSEATVGIIGLQSTLSIALDLVAQGKLSRLRAIEALSIGPAKALGLDAGVIKRGAKADLTLLDPNHIWSLDRSQIASVSANTPFLDDQMKARAKYVLIDGKVVVSDFNLVESHAT